MRWLVLVGLLMLAGTAAAQASTSGVLPSFFTISRLDRSISLLMMVFGTVGNVLYDPNMPGRMTAFSAMFAAFNSAMLVLNVMLIAYTTLFGLINTAYEGETLGKKLNTIWVPLRAVTGVALLIPTKTGYCIIQIIVMWIVLQGVGAADTVWTAALKAIQVEGSSAVLPQTGGQSNPSNSDSYVNGQIIQFQTQKKVEDILTSLVCVHLYISGYNKSLKTDNWVPVKYHDKTKNPNEMVYDFTFVPQYYAHSTGTVQTTCGQISYPDPVSIDSQSVKYYQARAISWSIDSIMNNLNEAAKEFVYNGGKIAGDPITAGALTMQDAINQAAEDYQAMLLANSNVGAVCKATDSNNTLNQMMSALNTLDCASQFGWAFAGAYYRTITIQSGSAGDISFFYDQLSVTQPYFTGTSAPEGSVPATQDDLRHFQTILEQSASNLSPVLVSSNQILTGGAGTDFGVSMSTPFNALLDWVVESFVYVVITGGQGDLINGEFIAAGTDPVADLQNMGERIINIVELIYLIFLVIEIVLVILSLTCGGLNPLLAIFYFVMKFGAMLTAFLGMLFAFGLVLAVYVPLIPFIVFFFGVMAWLMGVVEAMLAAPMVAIGIAAPEGHEVVGHAQPAVMLMTNVFIRPTLMVFGLIAGIILSDVGVALLNSVYEFVIQVDANFVNATSAPISPNGASPTDYGIGPFQLISYMGIYISIILVLINKCFALIHTIPDQVLNWIGGGVSQQFGQYQEGAEAVEKQAGSTMAGAGKFGKDMAKGKAKSATKKMGQQAGKKKGGDEGELADRQDDHPFGGDAGGGT